MTEITFRDDVTVELIDSMGNEQSIVRAARVSTLGAQTEATEAAGLVRFLMKEGHGTPFETPVLTFRFEVPVFVSRQIVKHRISSINEESGRYKEFEPTYYVPDEFRRVKQVGKTGAYTFVPDAGASRSARRWIKIVSKVATFAYRTMLRAGVAKEVARMVLPVNVYSTMYVTMNLRAWLNFVKLRTNYFGSHAQYEVALVGKAVMERLEEEFPNVMEQFYLEQKIV